MFHFNFTIVVSCLLNRAEHLSAIGLIVYHHFLVALSIRLIAAFFQSKLGSLLHSVGNGVLSSTLDLGHASFLSIKHLFRFDHSSILIFSKVACYGALRVGTLQEARISCLYAHHALR